MAVDRKFKITLLKSFDQLKRSSEIQSTDQKKRSFDQTPYLTETFNQLKRSSEIRSSDHSPKKGKKEKRRKEERNKRKRKKEKKRKEEKKKETKEKEKRKKKEKKKKGDRCFLQNCSGDQKGTKGPWRVIIFRVFSLTYLGK